MDLEQAIKHNPTLEALVQMSDRQLANNTAVALMLQRIALEQGISEGRFAKIALELTDGMIHKDHITLGNMAEAWLEGEEPKPPHLTLVRDKPSDD